MQLKCKPRPIWKRSVSELEAWDRKHYALFLQHTVPGREMLMSLKIHRPIRDSRPTCQSDDEEGSSGCYAQVPHSSAGLSSALSAAAGCCRESSDEHLSPDMVSSGPLPTSGRSSRDWYAGSSQGLDATTSTS